MGIPAKDDIEHLSERGFGRCLIDEIFGCEINVVTSTDGLEHHSLVNLTRARSDHG